MLIRKKYLKIQERLGMRVGVAEGIADIPVAKTPTDVLTILEELYKVGLRAFLMPQQLFDGIETIQDIYKEHYNNLIKIKNLASKYNIELSLRATSLPDEPLLDDKLKIYSNIASVMDLRSLVISPNFYKMMPKDQSIRLVVHKINEIIGDTRIKGKMGIETTGKTGEVGSTEDIVDIIKRTRATEPVLNWGNIHARGAGGLRDLSDFDFIINSIRKEITPQWLSNAYLIYSGVAYGPSGLIGKKPIKMSDLSLEYVIKTIMKFNIKGTLVFDVPHKEKEIVDIIEEFGDMVR
ncbi:MAG: hypothetical protein JW716_02680 [Candidatus Aenigmarchaeota archaeon]|nr:hypothetical protein [Candidatus Aenigmarchaeota archaeon]